MKKKRLGRPRGENTENANRRRKQLVNAAIESIVEHGLPATTLATISKASGLSQNTAVFYFKSKESLLLETFRYWMEEFRDFWTEALSSAGSDPVDRIMALAFSTIDPQVMTRQNLVFWNSFWNHASANASLAELSYRFETERLDVLFSLCEDAQALISGAIWTPKTVTHTLETMAEGIWVRMYYSPDYITLNDARMAIGTVLSVIFPTRAKDIMKRATSCP
jgi:AcrR family transcriptional regulator